MPVLLHFHIGIKDELIIVLTRVLMAFFHDLLIDYLVFNVQLFSMPVFSNVSPLYFYKYS